MLRSLLLVLCIGLVASLALSQEAATPEQAAAAVPVAADATAAVAEAAPLSDAAADAAIDAAIEAAAVVGADAAVGADAPAAAAAAAHVDGDCNNSPANENSFDTRAEASANTEEEVATPWFTGTLPPIPEWAQETKKTVSDIKLRVDRRENTEAKPREPHPDEPPPDPVREDIEFYAGVIAQWTRVLKENDDTHPATDKAMELVGLARRALFPSLKTDGPKVDRNKIRGRLHRFVHKHIVEDLEDD